MTNGANKTTTISARQAKLTALAGPSGLLRTKQMLSAGIHPEVIYEMKQQGQIIPLTRGIYEIQGRNVGARPSLTLVALKVPKAVFCQLTALDLHGLTTQIPTAVYLALPQGSTYPRLSWPPLKVSTSAEPVFSLGIQSIQNDGIAIRVYSPERTLVDCFLNRNKLGIDVCIEALKLYKERGQTDLGTLILIAQQRRAWTTMKPYVETIWGS